MKNPQKSSTAGKGEAAGRRKGYEAEGGAPGNDLLEDGQLRGVTPDGEIASGMHGGPQKRKESPGPQEGRKR